MKNKKIVVVIISAILLFCICCCCFSSLIYNYQNGFWFNYYKTEESKEQEYRNFLGTNDIKFTELDFYYAEDIFLRERYYFSIELHSKIPYLPENDFVHTANGVNSIYDQTMNFICDNYGEDVEVKLKVFSEEDDSGVSIIQDKDRPIETTCKEYNSL